MAEPTSRLDSDAELVRAAQAGCHAAFTELFSRHYPSVRRACLRRLGNSIDAEEAAQATFVRAFERIGQCEGERRFRAWVHVIAHRLCVDTVRARARTQPEEVPVPFEQPGTGAENPEQSLLAQERVRHLQEALATLSQRQRDAVVARTVDERGPGEIAAALGLSVGAVDSLLLRGRRRLARAYHRMAEERGAAATVTTISAAAVASGATARPRRVASGFSSAVSHVQHTALQLAATVGLLPATRPPGHGVATAVLTAVLAVQTASAPPSDSQSSRAEAFASRAPVVLPVRAPVAPLAESVGGSAVGGSLTALVGGLLDAARPPARPGRPGRPPAASSEQVPGDGPGALAAGFEPRSLAELAETVLGPLPSTAGPDGTEQGSRRPLADVILEAIERYAVPTDSPDDAAADSPDEPATSAKASKPTPAPKPIAGEPDPPVSDSPSGDDPPTADPPAGTAPGTPAPESAPTGDGSTTTSPPQAGSGILTPPADLASDVLRTAKNASPGLPPLLP